jgi:hypothetical protein
VPMQKDGGFTRQEPRQEDSVNDDDVPF